MDELSKCLLLIIVMMGGGLFMFWLLLRESGKTIESLRRSKEKLRHAVEAACDASENWKTKYNDLREHHRNIVNAATDARLLLANACRELNRGGDE